MGMDLKPIAPTADAPRDERGRPVWGRYNWTGWSWLCDFLDKHGVLTEEFSGCNDGDRISKQTCREVADTIERELSNLSKRDREWLEPHVTLWRTCGGYKQW